MENINDFKNDAYLDYMYNHEKYFGSVQEMNKADTNPKFKLDYWNKNQDKIVNAYIEFYELDASHEN